MYLSQLEDYQKASRRQNAEDDTIAEKLQEAKLLLKKSKRKDLYAVLGVARGSAASDQEVKTAYKKAALKWHPDRHSSGKEEKKAEAETRFKEIGEAFEILSDPTKRRLYDQGFDKEEIEQRAEHERQTHSHRTSSAGGCGGARRGGFHDFF
jgi:DnaJ family protein C protein 7